MKISLIAYFSHMQFVSELKQIDLMADEKAPVRISYRLLAINRSEMRINMEKKKIFVIGHKNPDTDSICSAIAYAQLKNLTDSGK